MVDKFLMAGSQPLHICDSEHGEKVVVLLHGYLESMLVWDSFVPYLYKDMRVVTVDIPGHGISMVDGECHSMEFLAQTICDGVKALGVDKFTVVGHSMGGYVALAICELFPEMLDGIILFSSTPNPDSEERRENRLREIQLVKQGKKELLAKVAPAAGFAVVNRGRMKDHIEDLAEQVYITEDDGVVALLNGMMTRKDQNEMLQKSPVSQMFIFGEMDDYIPKAAAETIIANHPQAKVAWLAKSGHMGFIEEAEASAQAIKSMVL